jgi:histone-lysine N-methyltransferase SETD8
MLSIPSAVGEKLLRKADKRQRLRLVLPVRENVETVDDAEEVAEDVEDKGEEALEVNDEELMEEEEDEEVSPRRTKRRNASEMKRLAAAQLEERLQDSEQGIKVSKEVGKGRGVRTTREFEKGEFITEYKGELISSKEAKQRESKKKNNKKGPEYMFYFKQSDKKLCIDATKEDRSYGRLLNHSRRRANCHAKLLAVGGVPRLLILASRDIEPSEELLIDYGDRSPESLRRHPWLAT